MDPAHLEELARLEESYWWHVAKRRLAMDVARKFAAPPGLVVEGGVGGARNLLEFQKLGYEVHGLDLMPAAIEHCHRRGISRADVHDLCQAWPIQNETASLVVMLDVLEHLADPVLALQHAQQTLVPNGSILLTVPAWPSLFGEWDRRLGHFRRYTPGMLREHVQGAGLTMRWLNFWNAFSLPPAVILRLWQRWFPRAQAAEFPRVSATTNRLLSHIAGWERALLSRCRLPVGLSLVAVVGKP
jgi:SAM-dependent methyltransferase